MIKKKSYSTQRYKSILLKSSRKLTSEITEIFDVTVPTVCAQIKRYKENGIKGLETHPGQGRKPITDYSDKELIRKTIEEDHQSVSKAREALERLPTKNNNITLQTFF